MTAIENVDAADEAARVQRLLAAELQAMELFAEVERRRLIVPGRSDREVSDAIRDLAHEMFGVTRYWHKRVVRSGEHTLRPHRENPPDRVFGEDDIVFADFGPIFDGWEADFGRTFVLGHDPVKQRLRDDLAEIFAAGQEHFFDTPDITGEQLFAYVDGLAAERGWEIGIQHSGHLIGDFPHEKIDDDKVTLYVTPGSSLPMRRLDPAGRLCHWILELHLISPAHGFGGFYEQLLDLRHC